MLAASPDPNSDYASSGFTPVNGAKQSPAGSIGLGRTPFNHSGRSGEGIRRKPSPVWKGDGDGIWGEMVETVGLVWGIPKESLEKDVASINRSGATDQVGYDHLSGNTADGANKG